MVDEGWIPKSPPFTRKELMMLDEGYQIPFPWPPKAGPDPVPWSPRRVIGGAMNETVIQPPEFYFDLSLYRMVVADLRCYNKTGTPTIYFETAVTPDYEDRATNNWVELSNATPTVGDDTFVWRADTDDMMKYLRWRVTDTEDFMLDFRVKLLLRTM